MKFKLFFFVVLLACVAAAPNFPVDVVFAVDTSGSMFDEAEVICNTISDVQAALSAKNINTSVSLWGIVYTQVPNFPQHFQCLTGNVAGELGGQVPGTWSCGALTELNQEHEESWGTATAIIADRFPWRAGALRFIFPVTDEGPCRGDIVNVHDVLSIDNAIEVALDNDAIVCPIIGNNSQGFVSPSVWGLAADIAAHTGCSANVANLPDLPGIIEGVINKIVESLTAPVLDCSDKTVSVDALSCTSMVDIDNDPKNAGLSYSYDFVGPYPVGITAVKLTVTSKSNGLSASCQANVEVLDSVPSCVPCNNPLPVTAMNVSYVYNISGDVDKDYLKLKLMGPVTDLREVVAWQIGFQRNLDDNVAYLANAKPCDYDEFGLLTTQFATWFNYQIGCTDVWEVSIPLKKLMVCGAQITTGSTTQDIQLTLYQSMIDHFQFGWIHSDTPRGVYRAYKVEVSLENFVSKSLSFTLYAPPTVLNCIIQERYNTIRNIYEIDVVKITQAYFDINAVTLLGTVRRPFNLVIDVYGDGSTDRVEVDVGPPCVFPGRFKINYDIRCKSMLCRDDAWNVAYVDFDIPDWEFCPSVVEVFRPTLDMFLCGDVNCNTQTKTHILGYEIKLKAMVTFTAPIKKVEFYDVFFDNGAGLRLYAKSMFNIESFGQFLQYSDGIGGSNGVLYLTWVPKKGTGLNEFFDTPDIFTSADFTIGVVVYVEADLDQKRGSFHVATTAAAPEDGYALGKSEMQISGSEIPSEGLSIGGLVGICLGVAAVVTLAAFFVVRRHRMTQNKQADKDVKMTTTQQV